jgi:hypothetical protein
VASTFVSITILLFYVVIATSYVVYMLSFSQWYVNAWDSMTELLALALHSSVNGVEEMRNTSAGIDTLGPLRVPVVFAARNGHVEIVLSGEGGNGKWWGKGEKLMGNTAYS